MYSFNSDRFWPGRRRAAAPAPRCLDAARERPTAKRHREDDRATAHRRPDSCRRSSRRRFLREKACSPRIAKGRGRGEHGRAMWSAGVRLPAPTKTISRPPSPLEMPPLAYIRIDDRRHMSTIMLRRSATVRRQPALPQRKPRRRCRTPGSQRRRGGEQRRVAGRRTRGSPPAKNNTSSSVAGDQQAETLSVIEDAPVRSGSSAARCSSAFGSARNVP